MQQLRTLISLRGLSQGVASTWPAAAEPASSVCRSQLAGMARWLSSTAPQAAEASSTIDPRSLQVGRR